MGIQLVLYWRVGKDIFDNRSTVQEIRTSGTREFSSFLFLFSAASIKNSYPVSRKTILHSRWMIDGQLTGRRLSIHEVEDLGSEGLLVLLTNEATTRTLGPLDCSTTQVQTWCLYLECSITIDQTMNFILYNQECPNFPPKSCSIMALNLTHFIQRI